jgi:hypothetical protein
LRFGVLSVAGGFWRVSRKSFDDPMLTMLAIGAGLAAALAGGLWLWVLIFMSIR